MRLFGRTTASSCSLTFYLKVNEQDEAVRPDYSTSLTRRSNLCSVSVQKHQHSIESHTTLKSPSKRFKPDPCKVMSAQQLDSIELNFILGKYDESLPPDSLYKDFESDEFLPPDSLHKDFESDESLPPDSLHKDFESE